MYSRNTSGWAKTTTHQPTIAPQATSTSLLGPLLPMMGASIVKSPAVGVSATTIPGRKLSAIAREARSPDPARGTAASAARTSTGHAARETNRYAERSSSATNASAGGTHWPMSPQKAATEAAHTGGSPPSSARAADDRAAAPPFHLPLLGGAAAAARTRQESSCTSSWPANAAAPYIPCARSGLRNHIRLRRKLATKAAVADEETTAATDESTCTATASAPAPGRPRASAKKRRSAADRMPA